MSTNPDDRARLNPERWRRIGAVLDRISDVDLRARPELLADACHTEGIRLDEVEPFLEAERRSSLFPECLDPAILDDALRDHDGIRANRLAPGDRLGPYEVVDCLGAGGMGEVYKARDARLGRIVAIKLLNADLATRPEGRVRFAREARVISGLNHPHICTLHDVGAHESIAGSDQAVDFLVMELVEGETLAARLMRGALPMKDALEYSAQIADALAAAHRQGIVHRDLKPANVMITTHGVKLLDFGLAALRSPHRPLDGVVSAGVTAEGTILGTLQYMAPEQVQGKPADERSDVFALGAIAYEMVTGRRAFEGENAASIIAAVIERDPPAMLPMRPDIPPALESTIRTCLAKDPNDRWQSTADLRRHLREIAARPDASIPPPARARESLFSRRRAQWAIVALVVLTVAGLAIVLRPGTRAIPPPPLSRFALPPPDGHRYADKQILAPDGRRLAFVAIHENGQRALWTRALDALAPQRLAGTEGAYHPFWSPGGDAVGFFAGSTLKKVDLATGTVETICRCDTGNGGGGSWNRDGVILFSKGLVADTLWRVPASGGTPVAVLPPQIGFSANVWPQFLADGERFFWLAVRAEKSGAYVGRLHTPDRTLILESSSANGATRASYAAGHLFFLRNHALMAQPFDVERLTLSGEPTRLVEEVEQTAPGRSFFDVAGDVLTYRQSVVAQNTARLRWFDRTGRDLGTLSGVGAYGDVALSRDGRYALANVRGASDATAGSLLRIDTASGTSTPVTSGGAPVWAPDGSRFAAAGGRGRGPRPRVLSVDGTPLDELRAVFTGQAWPSDWSSDGRFIVGETLQATTLRDLFLVDTRGDRKTVRELLRAAGNQTAPRISPDGRWLAYASDEGGRVPDVYVRPFPEGAGLWRISAGGGRSPLWTQNGRELLYVAPDGGMMSVVIAPGSEFKAAAPQPLFRNDALHAGFNREAPFGRFYDASTDGRRFLVVEPIGVPPAAPIVIVLNWRQLLMRADSRGAR
jgi:eukaryotic-like serine/threonine-protein kinase